jgi:sortase A
MGAAAAALVILDIRNHMDRIAELRSQQAEVAGGRATGPVVTAPGELELDAAPLEDVSASPAETSPAFRFISHLVIPRIGIETQVVPAPFVIQGEEGTWNVPPFVAGHAEYTAGPGQPGNAVLLGHVTSLTLGNVFETLDRARVGDVIHVASGDDDFPYQVTEIRRVSRTDVSVLDPTDTPTVSLITCTGLWLPHLRDYAERLVVRAELLSS